ncbi:fibronectin type III domain-containing protein [Emticicia fontis]
MRVNPTIRTAVIIALLLSCFNTYSQTPFISQLEGLNGGEEAKVTMIDGIMGKDYTIQYRLKNTSDWTDSPVKIKKSTQLSDGIITGLESNNNYCFRLIKRDSLTNADTFSNEACSINLKSTLLSDREVKLEWNGINNTELSRVAITVMEENGSNMNNIYPEKIADTSYVYNQLYCPVKFKFNISATHVYIENGIRKSTIIKSPQILVDPASMKTPPNLQTIGVVSSGTDNTISYNMVAVQPQFKYELYRSVNGSEMMKIAELINVNVFKHRDVDTEKNYYCYANKYVNECGNISELSGKACTMLLSSKTYGRLTWTPFTIQADEDLYKKEKTEYHIQLIDISGTVLHTIGNTTDTTIAIDVESLTPYLSNSKFRVLATIDGELNLYSQTIPFPIYSYSNSAPPYLILGNESLKNTLTVFPNPTEDKILINSSGAHVRFMELIDMKGRIIHKGEVLGDTINLNGFEEGKYILRLYDANKKLINIKNIVKW